MEHKKRNDADASARNGNKKAVGLGSACQVLITNITTYVTRGICICVLFYRSYNPCLFRKPMGLLTYSRAYFQVKT